MKKLFPYIAFACLAGFTATTTLPVMAVGCSSQMNKKLRFLEIAVMARRVYFSLASG